MRCSMPDRPEAWSTNAALEALRRLAPPDNTSARTTLAEFKMLVREQFFMLLLDRDAALAAIPKLLPENAMSAARYFRPFRTYCRQAPQYPARSPGA